jgi:hypothetical protein
MSESDETREFDSAFESTLTEGDDNTESSVVEFGQIDWNALWEEFGFDTEDSRGSFVISHTQLEAAIEVSEQDITIDGTSVIQQAVEDDILIEDHTTDQNGTQQRRGYVLMEGAT